MHDRTIATFAEIDGVDWFANVGTKDSANVNFVSSWKDAVGSCTGEAWQYLCNEAANQYRLRLLERDKLRFTKWNEIVREVKKTSVPLVLRKTQAVVHVNKLPQGFIDTVQWDILHLGMESEFADIYPPGFFASLAYWYSNGHFPCGWLGEFPKGRPIVF